MRSILNTAIRVAKEAGCFLLENFGKVRSVHTKGDRNFATNLDREAEVIIIKGIKQHFPSHGIIAEEKGSQNLNSDYLWIIDPLDGTHNFMRDVGVFGVSVGLVYKGDFVAGVIYMPQDKELYAAEKGSGAYKNGKRIKVSAIKELKKCSVSFDSSIRYAPVVMLKTLGVLAKKVFNVRMTGSSARHLSYLAEGKFDFCVEFFDKPWDFAGAVCIIREAGGQISDLRARPVTYKTTGYVASNGLVHDKVLKIVRDCSKGVLR